MNKTEMKKNKTEMKKNKNEIKKNKTEIKKNKTEIKKNKTEMKKNKTEIKKVKSCCTHKKNDVICKRKSDNKKFNLPRKIDREICLTRDIKGYTMKSSCAPYKDCSKKQFLYNKEDPSKSFNVYIDKNPRDTISIKYKTEDDVKNTIIKLEKLYKDDKYSHKRIWQVGMIMYVRLKFLKEKKPKQFKLSQKYFKFLGKRTKIKGKDERKKMKFNFN